MINTTRLLRRIEKYCKATHKARCGTGESTFAKNAGVDANIVARMRRGSDVGEPTLRRMDTFLADRGY